MPVFAAGAPYVAYQAGSYGYNDDNKFYDNLFDDFSTRLSAGYMWATNPCLSYGVEAGYQFYSKQSERIFDYTFSYKRQSLDLLGVLDYKINQQFNVFAKAGAVLVLQTFKLGDVYGVDSEDHNTVTPKAAIGVGYEILDNVQLNLSLNHEFEREYHAPSASSLLLGVQYSF